ncbi:MAG: IS1634 family transposase [Paludibacter sp.]
MYFKFSGRHNPHTGKSDWYYRLVESYRNSEGRVCHRTMLNVGFLDGEGLTTDQLNLIQKILTQRVENVQQLLFEIPVSNDPVVNRHVEEYYNRLVAEKRIDVLQEKPRKKPYAKGKDLEIIDLNSIRNKDVREIGAEWLSYQATEQLQIRTFLESQGWSDQEIRLAQTHIISRAVYPASEFETSRWIKENSAVCEVTGYDMDKITKDRLYAIARKLYKHKDELEEHLSHTTNELFDIEDRIMLYDLTNTYFEGRKQTSGLAKFGRSKEKRSDAKLVVLALVINPQGFIKYSAILEGNMSDPKTLESMINKLRIKTSGSAKKALVVIDAGIATEDNLKMIREKGYDYMCVSRSGLKHYALEADTSTITVTDNKKQKIDLCRVKSDKNTDYYLKVESHTKELKERSMNEQFRQRFEEGMQKIADSLTKKSGVKQLDKVHERIGKLKGKYPSIARYFDIEIQTAEYVQPKSKSKQRNKNKNGENQNKQEDQENQLIETQKKQLAIAIQWNIKPDVDINARRTKSVIRLSMFKINYSIFLIKNLDSLCTVNFVHI